MPPSRLLLALFEFTSLSMLGWLLAGVLPWLIHRWNRRQHRTTSWAAVDLLLTALRQKSRQVKLQQWLLIALRTAILVLVVLAAAEPELRHGALGSGGVGRSHTILVLDQSYSMGTRSQKSSRLQRAKAEARRLVESGRTGDVFSVVGWTQKADIVLGRPSADVSLVLSAIDALGQSEETAALPVALSAVQAALDRAKTELPHLGRHEVFFFSDLARNTWQVSPQEQSRWDALAKQARLAVVNVGDDTQDNLAIVDLSVEPTILLPGQEVSFSATLQSFGDRAWEDLEVELSLDGQSIESQQASLSSGGIATVRFLHSFDREGPHTVQVSVAGQVDQLAIDNRRWLVVEVRPQLRVACLEGKPGAANDIVRALAPSKLSADRVPTIRAEQIPAGQLRELNLTVYDAVFLCGMLDLNPREAAQVARFVQAGGGLAVLLDDQTLAAQLGDWLPVLVHKAVPLGEYHFDALQYAHPIVQPFRGNESAGLLKVTVMKYRRMKIKPERQSAERVLAFDTGDPALVVDRFGLGRVAVLAVPASLASRTEENTPWSSFAVSPSFLPIVRELLANLVGASWLQDRNLQVGQMAVCPWDGSRQETPVTVRGPDGSEQALSTPAAEDQGTILLPETSATGIYQVDTAQEPLARFAVNLDTLESDLATIDPRELPPQIVTNSASFPLEASADYAFAPSLLAAAAVCLLAELALACWLGRRWQ